LLLASLPAVKLNKTNAYFEQTAHHNWHTMFEGLPLNLEDHSTQLVQNVSLKKAALSKVAADISWQKLVK